MKELRIAIIDPVGKKAGLDHYDLSLAAALEKRSCIVKVFSNFEDGDHAKVSKKFSFSFKKGPFRSIGIVFEFISALRIANRSKVDVVILHLFHSSSIDLLFVRLTKIFGLKVNLIVHDVESFVGKGKGTVTRKIIKISDYVIVHNEFTFDELIRKTGNVSQGKIKVIPHGNYISLTKMTDRNTALKNFNLDPSKKYLLFFGMIKETKGLDILIDSLRSIQPDIHLIIAGRTRDLPFSHYQSLIDKEGQKGRVHSFIRYITIEERNFLFYAADVVVLPYRRIYQSGVMLMAMSYGKAVVASDLSANRSVINGKNGILFKANDPDDLALQINILMNDKEKMKEVTLSSKEYVTINHDWEKIADAFLKNIHRC